MRKRYLTAAIVCILCGSMLSTSCIGSFSLSNRLLNWNQRIGNKFLNELVFFAFWVLPAYEVSWLADILVINSIEFWSGRDPLAAGTKVIEGEQGRYLVKCDGRGYTVTSETEGNSIRLDFDTDKQEWSMELPSGQKHVLFTFVDDTHVKLPVDGGRDYRTVEISQAGCYAYRQMAESAAFAAR